MANKNILVSSNGKYEPISASVDDVTGVLSSSLPVTANTASFVGQSGLMQVYDGKLMPVGNSSVSNPQENYSGSVLSYDASEGFGPSRTGDVSFSGDISGNTVSGIKVRSVSNVTGGVLQSLYGGIGASSFSTNSFITTNGSGLIPTEANKIVVAASNNYISGDTALLNFLGLSEPIVYLYTGVVSASPYTSQQATQVNVASSTFTWTKPAGCRFIRVICQGGGGAGPGKWGSANGSCYMTGGGGGGYADVLFNAITIPSTVSISAGNGPPGLGTPTGLVYGLGGGHSSFGNYIISYGGLGGMFFNTNTGTLNAAGGAGYLSSGGVGGGRGQTGRSVSIGGAGGGCSGNGFGAGFAGGSVTYLGASGGVGGAVWAAWSIAQDGVRKNNFNFKKYYIPINSTQVALSNNTFPALVCGGGGGGGRNGGNGGSADYGSGGGGAGNYSGAPFGVGGNGGKGYVLIICY